MKDRRILPPTYLLIGLLAMLVLHFLVPIAQLVAFPWTLLGLLPLALGIALNISADNLFKQAHTTVKPGAESTVLVTSGPFHFTRNPMYLGFLLVLSGVAILLGSLAPFAIVVAIAILIDRLFISMEEQMLSATFGAAWQAYARATRRWI
jgi:protein-S-isoprenylcysteine O-methyltransferase Ste14